MTALDEQPADPDPSSPSRPQSDDSLDGVDAELMQEVLQGLSRAQKTLPSKLFYDERGLSLFQEISTTPEYYLTRSELSIMRDHAFQMAARMGPGCLLIEYGSAATDKARLLLDRLESPAGYVSVDISEKHLETAIRDLRRDYPDLPVYGVCADFTTAFTLPEPETMTERRVIYFAGSTIGNFEPLAARALLEGMKRHLDVGDGLLIGIDLEKDADTLHRAYNDRQGITAAFNLNILSHLNRELQADFRLELFEHRAFYNPADARIEMHLESRVEQTVSIGGRTFSFRPGETIHTESSHKYTVERFSQGAAEVGFSLEEDWTDDDSNFGVLFLSVD